MQSTRTYSDECKFCARYLLDNGVQSSNFDEVVALLSDLDPDFELVKIEKSDFFTDLAQKLRELWPSGEKDGKWPWRDSVQNIAKRLKFLWEDRKLGQYTLEECLTAARRYLAQYEDNTKYMQVLKYFIFKQKSVVQADGKIHYTHESKFADYLESSFTDALFNEYYSENELNDQGTII